MPDVNINIPRDTDEEIEERRKKKEKELLLGQTISQDLPINELLKKFDESVQAKTSQELLDVIAKL